MPLHHDDDGVAANRLAGRALLAAFVAPFALAAPAPAAPVAARADFAADVRPLLEARCFRCHGPAAQKSGLRLDVRDAALAGGDSGPAIVPGRSGESLLFLFVAGLDAGGRRMPLEGEPLAAAEIETIRAWIDSGAPWPDDLSGESAARVVSDHWAYRPPERKEPPSLLSNPAFVRNPIDAFVLERLDREGLEPAPEADRATLLRRLSLDLTGLPPTVAELDAFLADGAPGAYERQVDRLLASPRFGERQASHWLDLARYADTHGFEKDPRRTMWRWRDWVIDAFNRDLPYDRFVVEQMAGDLLENPSPDQVLATGFHRNTMINEEGGVDKEEARFETLVDRVNTTASAFLGTTLACAQCHTHKYDPFTQREYYRFLAFFDGDDEPAIPAPTPEIEAARAAAEAEIASLEEALRAPDPALDAAQAEWERAALERLVPWRPLVPAGVLSAGGAKASILPDGSVLLSGENPLADSVTIVASADGAALEGVAAIRIEALTHESLPHGGPGRHENATFVLTEARLRVAPRGRPAESRPVPFARARASYAQQGHDPATVIDGRPESGWAIDAWQGDAFRVDRALVLDLAEPLAGFPAGATLSLSIENGSAWPEANLGRFRVSVAAAADAGADLDLPLGVARALSRAAGERTDADRALLRDRFRSAAPETSALRERLARARARLPSVPTALVLAKSAEPRETRLRIRGAFTSPGERVTPGTPAVLPPLETAAGGGAPSRLDLARWIASPKNPLTARVAVNRMWERLFGRGLVATSEDFGTQGERPTHPALLDWLATEFAREGFGVKRLLRAIVTSSTYRQSSRVPAALLERDPENRLLARGARFRVDAETVRDVALAASGLLEPRIGGPSVFPPQPDGIWTMIYSNDRWVTDHGPRRYRRGLYTFWRRTAPYPSMSLFDVPSREVSCTRRPRTNTPLQALVTLNDPAFVEAAVALGARLLGAAADDPSRAAELGFRLCVARRPDASEVGRLLDLHRSERARFEADPAAAAEFVSNGPAPRVAERPAELAAWSVVASVLLNLDETMTRE